jgi:peptidoglycan/LPS O-acetylase OafA/YrhL
MIALRGAHGQPTTMDRGEGGRVMAEAATAAQPVATGKRVSALDWLRVLVVLGLIPYHAAVVFAVGPGDYIKSPARSIVFDLAATLVAFLGMPLLFLVSGAATWFALGRRRPARYVLERVGRLAVPFVVGVLLLVPIQLYVDRRADPSYHVAYPQFYLTFLTDWANIARHGVFGRGFQYWGHLWFILYLLAVSVFLLPLLLWLRGTAAQRPLAYLASRCGQLLGVFLLGAPLVLVEVALQGPIGPRAATDYANLYSGAAGLVLYAVTFALGYLLFTDQRVRLALVRYRSVALGQAATLLLVHEVALAVAGRALGTAPVGALVIRGVRGYITWCLLVAALGFALRYFTANTALLRYLNEACYPVYVLHMPVLTILGFYLVRWNPPILIGYLLLLATTASVTFALYEGFVRRIPAVRFLFGLKPRPGALTL